MLPHLALDADGHAHAEGGQHPKHKMYDFHVHRGSNSNK